MIRTASTSYFENLDAPADSHFDESNRFASEDDFDAIIAAPKDQDRIATAPGIAEPHREPCLKCRGTGQFVSYSGRPLGQCFSCKGTGVLQYKTSKEDRARNRASSAARKVARADEAFARFAEQNPKIAEWMKGNDFAFAVAMADAVRRYGSLTPNQIAACLRCIEKRDAAIAAKAARTENAPTVSTAKIEEAFSKAAAALKAPKLRVAGMTISHAKASSANAGALYVKADGLYLGKIMGGKFIASRDCRAEDQTRVLEVANDPMGAAIAYGRLTGNCACCGRPLTKAESVERGIGPICAEKFGW